MQITSDARSLFNPGQAENFFDIADLPSFDASQNTSFSRTNALWLSEFSRLIYRQGTDELKSATGPSRNEILESRGWRETAFICLPSLQAAVFESHDGQCAALVFRGTLGLRDLLTDSQFLMEAWETGGLVHRGFRRSFATAWPWCEQQLKRLRCPVFFTGHSLGGAHATLAAAKVLSSPALPKPAALYTVGSPRVRDSKFADALQGFLHCRCVNDQDLVPTIPTAFSLPSFPIYQHTGNLHRLTPDGGLELGVAGADVRGEKNPLGGIQEFTQNLRRMLANVASGQALPGSLIDHTPMNYTARLESLRIS